MKEDVSTIYRDESVTRRLPSAGHNYKVGVYLCGVVCTYAYVIYVVVMANV